MPPPLLNPEGINLKSPNLDALGIFYIVFAILYSILVTIGLCRLYQKRKTKEVQLRGIRLTFCAILSLHIYLVLVLLVYPENGLFNCGTEFWVMSIALPLGIATFQASNVRLLSYYIRQHRLIYGPQYGLRKVRYNIFTIAGFKGMWAQLDLAPKTQICICVGGFCTVVTTVVLYFGSHMFHSFGFFGKSVDPWACRRGFEWIPSIFWQLFWSAMFGPYCLWRGRNISDFHRWAIQTRIAIVASIPGTPMWLAFTYIRHPNIIAINKYFPPAMWFTPCIITLQQTLIWFPLYDHWRPKIQEFNSTEYYVVDPQTGELVEPRNSWTKSSPNPSFKSLFSTLTFGKSRKDLAGYPSINSSVEDIQLNSVTPSVPSLKRASNVSSDLESGRAPETTESNRGRFRRFFLKDAGQRPQAPAKQENDPPSPSPLGPTPPVAIEESQETDSQSDTITTEPSPVDPDAQTYPSVKTMAEIHPAFRTIDSTGMIPKETSRTVLLTTTVPVPRQRTGAQTSKRQIHSRAALQLQLQHNVMPLLEFAASRDFSSENIIFLEEVRKFRSKWAQAVEFLIMPEEMYRQQYAEAAQIFFVLVNPQTSEFNINIDSRIYNNLARLFKELRWEPYEDRSGAPNVITPWDNFWNDVQDGVPGTKACGLDRPISEMGRILPASHHDFGNFGFSEKLSSRSKQTRTKVPELWIPPDFKHTVFGEAYESVLLTVLHNTWPKFVASTSRNNIVYHQLAMAEKAREQRRRSETSSGEPMTLEEILRSGPGGQN